MQTALIALAAVLSLGGVAWTAHEHLTDERSAFDPVGLDCSQPLVPLVAASQEGALVVAAQNHAEAGELRVCVYDEQRVKRIDLTFPLDANANAGRVIRLPVAEYGVVLRIADATGSSAMTAHSADLRKCAEQLHEVDTWFTSTERRLEGGRQSCTQVASANEADAMGEWHGQDQLLSLPDLQRAGPGMIAVGAGLALAVPLLVWLRSDVRFLVLGLFTRLQRPALLDQPTRARINDLVEQQPGIHGALIAERLELGTGTAVHHLRVLVRERQLSRVQAFGRAHFFAYGRYSPTQMRLLAAQRHASLRRVYRAVVDTPGLSLTDLSARSGYSIGQTSKLARRLQREGLLRSQTSGRAILWHPAQS